MIESETEMTTETDSATVITTTPTNAATTITATTTNTTLTMDNNNNTNSSSGTITETIPNNNTIIDSATKYGETELILLGILLANMNLMTHLNFNKCKIALIYAYFQLSTKIINN